MKQLSISRFAGCVLLVSTLLISTGGCVDTMQYRYISLLDVEGIRVTKQERPNLKHFHLMESTFPIDYELSRSAYQLRFRVATDDFAPHIWIEATDPSGARLLVKPRSDRLPTGQRSHPCGAYSTTKPSLELRFAWLRCGTDAAPEERVIAFDVVDASGATLGEEDLRFALVENGLHFAPDGP